ncbi:MAG: ferrous iron transport protein B [Acidilobus sp.]
MRTERISVVKIAVTGIPNSGKSTLVSWLSGAFLKTANYPGTTVSVDEVVFNLKGVKVRMVDLPGAYSLRAGMPDEYVAAKEVLLGDYDGIIVVGSAVSPELTFYLLLQVMELGKPTILVLNMMDLAERRGLEYDLEGLRKALGIPIIPAVATRGKGLAELRDLLAKVSESKPSVTRAVDYGKLEGYVDNIVKSLNVSRGVAIEILSDNPVTRELANESVRSIVNQALQEVPDLTNYVISVRWKAVRSLVNSFVKKGKVVSIGKLDKLLMNPRYGPLFSMLILFSVAEAIFLALEPLVDMLSEALGIIPIINLVESLINYEILRSFIIDGVWNGLTTLVSFTPYVFGVMFIVAFIEDSGLMVRISFPIERWLRIVGIPSRGLLYLIAGSACNVPAIMATRAVPSTRDRVLTSLMIPYIPCTARFVVISLIAAAVLPSLVGLVIIIPYASALIGIFIVSNITRTRLGLPAKRQPYAYELPPIVLPFHRAFIKKVWHYTYQFLVRAGLFISLFIVLMWFLSISGPSGVVGPAALNSPALIKMTWLGIVGNVMSPLLRPLGIPWEFSASLVYGYIFKEVVLSTLAVLYGVREGRSQGGLLYALKTSLSIPSALSLIVFTTLYSPCIATLVVESRVAGTRLTVINTMLQFTIALALSYATYYTAVLFISAR